MKSRTTKKLRQFRNRSIWPFILAFVGMLFIGTFLVTGMVAAILEGMANNKMHDAWRDAYKYGKYIEAELDAGKNANAVVEAIKNEPGAPVAINVYDTNDRLLASYGAMIEDELEDKEITVPDLDISYWGVFFGPKTRDYSVTIDAGDLLENIGRGFADVIDNGEYANIYIQDIYEFDYWINTGYFDFAYDKIDLESLEGSINVEVIFEGESVLESNLSDYAMMTATSDSNYRIYMKYGQKLYLSDCYIILPIAGIALLVFLIMIIVQLSSTISNITRQRAMLKMLMEDPVTEGNNMLAFEQYAGNTLRRKKKRGYAIVDLSLSRYQNYCTLYGMEEGERLLTAMYRALSKRLGRGEMVAKVSASDSVILLGAKNSENVEKELMARMKNIMENLPEDLRVTRRGVSPLQGISNLVLKAGMYVMNPALDREARIKRNARSHSIDQLYMKAEIAKQGLGDEAGLMLYNHKMWEDELWAQKVEDMMQDALDSSEFQVYIQPKYHPSTEELMGGEALVRWISPKEGFISPGQFIPIFEKNGFITKLDDYMITHTAELQAKWLAEGKKIVPISVNVSRLHFSQSDLAEHIKELVDRYSLPHKYIEIELTESAFFDDKKMLLETVKKLQSYDFEVSMDDFGAGYSSLNSLKDLPLNVLKLDAEFFRGDVFDSRGEIVVSEAIALAKQLNMRIVAEGIEKKEQVDFLADQDCDMIQGYYFAKPMPAGEYEGRMKNSGENEPEKTAEKSAEAEAVVVESVPAEAEAVVVEPVPAETEAGATDTAVSVPNENAEM